MTDLTSRGTFETERDIDAGGVWLRGELHLPLDARGLVTFVHGSGSGRLSPRNQFVARVLQQAGLGTLLFDLLTPEEEQAERYTRHLRFDIELLARRVGEASRWLAQQPEMQGLRVGYFGASTGAAAAIVAAADRPGTVSAIVSRGGRPDLAGPALEQVDAPTLLIVGGDDDQVLELNRQAMALMSTECELDVIPGAGHLFAEGDTLATAAEHAAAWLDRYLQ